MWLTSDFFFSSKSFARGGDGIVSVRSRIWLGFFGGAGGATGSGIYGWMSGQTMSRAILLAAAGALGGFIGGYLVGRRLP
jgi:hypothetical protein